MHRHLLRSLRAVVLLVLVLAAVVAPATGCADRATEEARPPAPPATVTPTVTPPPPVTPSVTAETQNDGARSPMDDAPRAGGAVTAAVLRVVDGDTIVVRLPDGSEERVRYIGIDAPEAPRDDDTGEPLSSEATAGNQELLAGGVVRLKFDQDLRDGYGRLLAYVYAEDVLVNEALVRQGLAEARSYPPNTARDAELDAAERDARTARRGIWGMTEE